MKTKDYFNEGTPFQSMKPALSKAAVMPSCLRLSLKTKWFEMTSANGKTEDYREINDYWCRRLLELDEETEWWLDRLDNSVFDELEYKNVAFREKPSHIDYEQVPYGEIRHYSLNAVYDAFEYICSKL